MRKYASVPPFRLRTQHEKEDFLLDKKSEITTKRKIGKITYLVQALPSENATDTIQKKMEKLIIKDLQKVPGNPGFFESK